MAPLSIEGGAIFNAYVMAVLYISTVMQRKAEA